MRIINLTQHSATPEQSAQGVVDVLPGHRAWLTDILTFCDLPSNADMAERADLLAEYAAMYELADEVYPTHAMIGGAPFFMSALESALLDHGVRPLYAFSVRESIEQTMPDGTVKKISVFKHSGFVEVAP